MFPTRGSAVMPADRGQVAVVRSAVAERHALAVRDCAAPPHFVGQEGKVPLLAGIGFGHE